MDFTLKTGFDLSNQNNLSEKDILDIGSMVVVFIENATKTAAMYTEHSGRNGVTVSDIHLGLKLEAMIFLKRNDNLIKAQNIIKEYNEMIDNEIPSDNEDELNEDELNEDEQVIQKFSKSKHIDCPLCDVLNNIDEEWKNFVPETDFQKILKKNIDKICDNNIYD